MNKLLVIGLTVVLLFGIALFAFVNTTNEPEPASEPRQTDPMPMEHVTYRGIIDEIQDGGVLTTGLEGVDGPVVVHLPENFDMNLLPPVGEEIHVLFDGSVAESYPMQIWADKVILSDDQPIPIPDLPDEPKDLPASPDTVRFTINNAIRSIHTGMNFELVLEVNPTTGYRTELSYPDALVLESDVFISQSKSSTLVGAGSIRILQFSSQNPGSYEIVCDVVAPSGDIDHTYTIGVEITE